jgi:GT2 family glycosyltransferase
VVPLLSTSDDNQEMYDWLQIFEKADPSHRKLIFLPENRGWANAVNAGLRFIFSPPGDYMRNYILLSNNDVEYHPGWYEKALSLYERYPKIGIFAVWKHTAHGVKEDLGDLIIKDQMPAVGWLMKKEVLEDLGDLTENGACDTKGGNGEDVDYCIKAGQKGYWIAAPKEDIAVHIDGY